MAQRNGLALEQEAYNWIKSNARFGKDWTLLNGKGVFDIESKFYAIDVVSLDNAGYLRIEKKDLRVHYKYLMDNNFDDGLIMFKVGLNWYVFSITPYSIKKVNGKRSIKYEDIKGICQTAHQYFVDDVVTLRIDGDDAVFSFGDKEYERTPILTFDQVFSS